MATDSQARSAIVSGAGRGIGREVARELGALGYGVLALARTESELNAVVTEIRHGGGRAQLLCGDVRDFSSATSAIELAGRLGALEILVNNAGVLGADGLPWEVDPDEFWSVIEVNLRGPYNLARAVLPTMIANGRGRIVNVSSMAGAVPVARSAAYSVSKAALMRLSDNFDAALGDVGVKVFDVMPGRVRTAMTADRFDDETSWMPVEYVASAVVALATGAHDEFAGRAVSVSSDWLALARRIARSPDGGRLRLRSLDT